MEKKMLLWMAGIICLNHICNRDIRQRFGVVDLAHTLREAHLPWLGQVLRAAGDKSRSFDLNAPGKRPKGQPKQRWLPTTQADFKLAGIHPEHGARQGKVASKDHQRGPATKREER
ncbi:hypothetical protein ANCDUO_15984 [Ancylostoma duodenale]|uniref:Uncharacterized protein n=1 Tax=Ancylostoma duodenale TaxID=51022 RepID=A0A0C2FZ57_9BILA|nr:hypothetical protein ANCDUO_15984 [Ancylostoma duodenale]